MKDTGIIPLARMASLRRRARDAMNSGIPEVGDTHDLLGVIGRMSPLMILDLCDAWDARRGAVRRRDVVDVEALETVT